MVLLVVVVEYFSNLFDYCNIWFFVVISAHEH